MTDTENTTEKSFLTKFIDFCKKYIGKSLIFILLFCMFLTNLLALSLSIKCNKGESSFILRIASALYAFMFGVLYIIINYFMYRVQLKNNPCDNVCGNPFN